MTGITVDQVTKTFDGKTVLKGIDLTVADGEFVCLLGPSGCGKSTLLRCVAGLETPESGRILLGDEVVYAADQGLDLPPEKRRLGMVFQSFALWPHLTVFQNVSYPLRRQRVARPEIRRRVMEALDMVGLTDYADVYPGTLSGGQQQRVSLARAVVARPRLLLFDEPLSSLDANLRGQMRREIRRIQRHLNATALYVTHDREDAGGLADRVTVLQDGRVVQQGTPRTVFARPATSFVAQFVGFDNFLPAEIAGPVSGAGQDECLVTLGNGRKVLAGHDGEPVAGEQVLVAVRGRMLAVAPAGGAADPRCLLEGTVETIAYLGDDVEITVREQDVSVVARIRPGQSADLAEGARVRLVTTAGAAVAVPARAPRAHDIPVTTP